MIEVLVAIVILGLVASAAAAISITGVLLMSEDNQERQLDATAAQFASLVFGRDVQGAAQVTAPCGPTALGTHLVTLQASDDPTSFVEYRHTPNKPFDLIRIECGGSSRTVVDGLDVKPVVKCDPPADDELALAPCAEGALPRIIRLTASRTAAFDFELDGARRVTDSEDLPPLKVPNFVALGGGMPLTIGGTSTIRVIGSAFVNAPCAIAPLPCEDRPVVTFNGGARLEVCEEIRDDGSCVEGQFSIQDGGTCPGCATNATPSVHDSYPVEIPDPLRFLPDPSTAGVPFRTDCPEQVVNGLDRRVCPPGIYEAQFPPSLGSGDVKDFILQPGEYILRNGIKLPNGSLRGTGVMIFNESGSISINGGDVDLAAPASGIYTGILLFQARTNPATITINGNTEIDALTVLAGTMYAPGSTGFELGSGKGSMTVGRIVGTSLSTSGSGTVIVGG